MNEEVLMQFREIIEQENERQIRMKLFSEAVDYEHEKKIIIGVLPGDGIGPVIMNEAIETIGLLLSEELREKKIEIKEIQGLTIEERSRLGQSVPENVLSEIKKCHVILKGPSTTPRHGDQWANLPSANGILRKELDLYANIRPIKIPQRGIEWTFFRENIEGSYVLGSKGIQVNEELSLDFVVETKWGSRRIAKRAFDFAKSHGKSCVTAITKANIIKLTDGNFLKACYEISENYPEIKFQERLIDSAAAKLNDNSFHEGMEVFVMPNLYGDIMTDIAAEIQGGLGSVGSASVGNRYALFEAVHGTAPRLIERGLKESADPSSLLRATSMMLDHIGYEEKAEVLLNALEVCEKERYLIISGKERNCNTREYGAYLRLKVANSLRDKS